MKVTFLGATHEVTGSCTLMECGNNRGLVDCGMGPGVRTAFENQKPLPVAAGEIDCVALVTHAHIDHSGNLPLLFQARAFDGPIYATDARRATFCRIMLRDCAHIQVS